MKWYPIVQILCWIPGTINRILVLSDKNEMFFMLVLQTIFDSLVGFFTMLVFMTSPENKHSILICCKKIFRKKTKFYVLPSETIN